jgi:predicted MPP superfamily phosphohydrolase
MNMLFDLITHSLPDLWQNRTRRTQLLGGMGMLVGMGAGLAGHALLAEPLHVRLDAMTIRLAHAQGRLPQAGLRILHLSDTHFRGEHWREQPKIDSIRRACDGLQYDLLIHTGDFLHYDTGLPNVLALLDTLPRPRLGSYAVFGNHDYVTYSHSGMLARAWAKFSEIHAARNGHPDRSPWKLAGTVVEFADYFANSPLDLKRVGNNDVDALEAVLAARGFVLLHNRSLRLDEPGRGLDIYLAGVDDVTEGAPALDCALAEIPCDAPTILLSHNPDILLDPAIAQVDLVLSGHTHGGQIVLPLLGAAHTQSEILHRHEVSGYLRRGKTQVYITRGIGEGIPLRFGAAPQVTLITVLPA